MTTKTTGVLLVDVGTPKVLTRESVQEYLTEFLGDPFVIRGPAWVRDILFKKILVPWRASKSLEKYRRIWRPEGSPLRVESTQVAQALESVLNDSTSRWVVRSVFHYGEPTIEEGVAEMRSLGVDDLVIVPLFPQWALSTRGSLEDRLQRLNLYGVPETDKGFSRVQVAPVFYRHSGFLDAQAELLKIALPPVLNDEVAVVYSFHGLPQSHIRAVVPSCKQCLKREGECRPAPFAQPYCYRYQCFETAKLISQKLNLFHWDVAFQSRLGPTRWLDPSLMEVTAQLLDQGVKTLIVQCPSFVVDGLESLEEVGMDLKEYFLRHGGKQFILVPALNHSSLWIEALKEIVLQQMQAIADKDPNGGINHRASNQNN